MMDRSVKAVAKTGVAMVAVPWSMFVAAFLYYTLLALLAISVAQLTDLFMAVAYGLPAALYGVMLVTRLGRSVVLAFPAQVRLHGVHAFPR